ncbi:ATP-binding protein [Streptomyces sp. B1866]|uniref:ATP-binding protein n=1 Tax=Streptomyces sp. B1866 TaxID=3075431 RepID=UPI002891BA29|nr:ATP-binding protein [Streptomyces sp. B1866]MDT3399012.1 ATP-binding protein [Streptomyces sp. B1866]
MAVRLSTVGRQPVREAVVRMSLTRQQVFPCHSTSVKAARDFVADALTGWGYGDLLEEVSLCVSEIATNALVHGAPPSRTFAVRLEARADLVRIEVHDDSELLPVPCSTDHCRENGRGLLLVNELADGWGIDKQPVGKAVWLAFKSSGQ